MPSAVDPSMRCMASAYGQFSKHGRGHGVGGHDQAVLPPIDARNGQHQQPPRPLRRTGDTPPQQRTAGVVECCDALGRQLDPRRLPAFVTHERDAERRTGREREPNGSGRPHMRGRGEVNGSRANEREGQYGQPHGERAPQRDAPRRACFPIVARRLRQRAALLQTRLKTSVPFVPPNPNEFFNATSIFMSRAVFAQ